MAVVIGIDGGGTKTKGLMADENGNVFAVATAGASNPNALDRVTLKNRLKSIFVELGEQAPEQFKKVSFCFAGMAGVGEGTTRNALHEVISELCVEYGINFKIHNDGINALFAGTFGKPGMVLISGTGSITYGLSADGIFKRVGGWGYLFDDQGSGYDVGKRGLTAVFKAYDGRGKETSLTEKILNYLKVEDVPSIIPAIYQDEQPRTKIASLSRFVLEAYDEEDMVASSIVEEAASQLAKSVRAMHEQLSSNYTPKDVILAGGMFNRSDVLLPIIEDYLPMKLQFKKLELEPVVGAVVAALKEMNIEVSKEFAENIKKYSW